MDGEVPDVDVSDGGCAAIHVSKILNGDSEDASFDSRVLSPLDLARNQKSKTPYANGAVPPADSPDDSELRTCGATPKVQISASNSHLTTRGDNELKSGCIPIGLGN
jgi:hypothetical protein